MPGNSTDEITFLLHLSEEFKSKYLGIRLWREDGTSSLKADFHDYCKGSVDYWKICSFPFSSFGLFHGSDGIILENGSPFSDGTSQFRVKALQVVVRSDRRIIGEFIRKRFEGQGILQTIEAKREMELRSLEKRGEEEEGTLIERREIVSPLVKSFAETKNWIGDCPIL